MEEKENKTRTSKPEENLDEEAKELNALAKAFVVSLTWSLAGLTTPKKSPQPQQDTPK